jgi:hypothetical protein
VKSMAAGFGELSAGRINLRAFPHGLYVTAVMTVVTVDVTVLTVEVTVVTIW